MDILPGRQRDGSRTRRSASPGYRSNSAAKKGSTQHETIYYVLRDKLRPEAAAAYKQWLAEHTGVRSEQAGWTYVGTYLDVMGVDRYDYETRWELNSHGSVNTRLLDTDTEQRIQDRLPFVEEGQVAVMKALSGIVPRAH